MPNLIGDFFVWVTLTILGVTIGGGVLLLLAAGILLWVGVASREDLDNLF